MGALADEVCTRLRDRLADRDPDRTWRTEYRIDDTPVDVAGVGADLVIVELEWRRADPADNTAKLFRHLRSGTLAEFDRIAVYQAFTRYYDLDSGGVSAKRLNAEFVGGRVARTVAGTAYRALSLPIDPPKRGGALPEDWRAAVDALADVILIKQPR